MNFYLDYCETICYMSKAHGFRIYMSVIRDIIPNSSPYAPASRISNRKQNESMAGRK